jgi:hypothetical protein
MKNRLLRIGAIILGAPVFFYVTGGRTGLLAIVPDLMIVIGFCAFIVGKYARARRGGWSVLTHRPIGVPMLVGYTAITLYGLYEFFLSTTPVVLLAWLNVAFLASLLCYLVWKIFIFPKYPPRDDGGNRPRRPSPTRGPGGRLLPPNGRAISAWLTPEFKGLATSDR